MMTRVFVEFWMRASRLSEVHVWILQVHACHVIKFNSPNRSTGLYKLHPLRVLGVYNFYNTSPSSLLRFRL
jgi:hypothetical protein